MKANRDIDLTLLKPTTLVADIEQACTEAKAKGTACLPLPSLFVAKAKQLLNGSNVKIAAAIGYPYGYSATEVKLSEILLAILDGVDELYVTANIMAIKNSDWHYIAKEINQILPVATAKQKTVKIIADTILLTPDEIQKLFKLVQPAGIEIIEAAL